MTVTPHSIAGAGAAAAYYAQDNYYTADQEGPSHWGGAGAEKLGLTGQVSACVFQSVLEGKLPGGIEISGDGKGNRSPGFELTFSPSKSVSLVALIGGDARIINAHERAVADTMRWAEKRLATAREGKGGAQNIATGNLLYAAFRHDLSRNRDPQLHSHVVIANATQRPDGEWRAIHNRPIWSNASLIGSIYHAHLRAGLEKLGYGTELTGKHGQFEISGISRQTIMEFSGRRADILAKAKELGLVSPQAMEAIALRTREGKNPDDAQVARSLWAAKDARHGVEIHAVVQAAAARTKRPRTILDAVRAWGEALLERVTRAFGPRPEPLLENAEGVRRGADLAAVYSVAAGVRHLSERQASFPYLELVKASLNFAERGASIVEVEARIEALRNRGVLITGRKGTANANQLTTRDIQQTERMLVKTAREAIGTGEALVERAQAVAHLADVARGMGITLSAEQENAALALLSGTNAIQIVQGDAGSGKSTLFALVDQVAKREGRELLVLVPQNKLIEDLAEKGMAVRSLESVLEAYGNRGARPRLDDTGRDLLAGKLVILEEASMVSHRQMASLFSIVQEARAGRLGLVGDSLQISSPEAGRPLALLQDRGLPIERLSENRRQQTDQLREAAMLARQGDISGVFAALGDKVIESENPALTAARQYLALTPQERGGVSILTSGHVLREEVLEYVRDGLLARGELGQQAVTLPVWDHLNLTREEIRHIAYWAEGMRLDLYNAQAGLGRGSYEVALVERSQGLVELVRDGVAFPFDPRDLDPGGKGASLCVAGQIEVREGDRLVFGATDHERGIMSGTRATCTAIDGQSLQLETGDRVVSLAEGDPLRERLSHAAVLNMHRAQGMTVDHAITVMSSHDTLLNSESLHYVLQTRAREDVTLHTDDAQGLRVSIESHPGDPPHAWDVAPELAERGGEHWDPRTGELLGNTAVAEIQVVLSELKASLSAIFPPGNPPADQKEKPSREPKPERERDERQIEREIERER